jgi:hypothetical protein
VTLGPLAGGYHKYLGAAVAMVLAMSSHAWADGGRTVESSVTVTVSSVVTCDARSCTSTDEESAEPVKISDKNGITYIY